ncbi:MAG: FHA domain-containing protein [Acidimicrobiia bacterium]|nr:FHA domain-containing protein [Acidimicrobiia bacterium]MDH4308077.1 FHA domain-containing protein [Acidimicrobiia bacterium]
MHCPSCNAVVPAGSNQCPECGTHIESDPTVIFFPLSDHPGLTAEQASDLAGVQGFALVVERGPRAGMTFVLPAGSTTVGRHPESDIFLDDITVSRHHCRFVAGDAELMIEDSGSTNGTYVNGDRVDRVGLEPGDEVLIGRFHLIVARGDG